MTLLKRLRRAINRRSDPHDPEQALGEHELERLGEESRLQAERNRASAPPPILPVPPGTDGIGSVGGGF
jgi:hypothetical protein